MGCNCGDANRVTREQAQAKRSGPFDPNLYGRQGLHADKGAKLSAPVAKQPR